MRPRGTGRFVLPLLVSLAAFDVGFTRVIAGGVRVFGNWGIVVALVGFGFLLAVRSLARLVRRPPAHVRDG